MFKKSYFGLDLSGDLMRTKQIPQLSHNNTENHTRSSNQNVLVTEFEDDLLHSSREINGKDFNLNHET